MGCDAFVIGEALIDVTRALDGTTSEHVGGSPANVALGLGRLGYDVTLVTQVGHDDHGHRIQSHLAESGVKLPGLHDRPTSTATAVIHSDGHAEYDFDITWGRFTPPRNVETRVLHAGSIACFLQPGADSVLEAFNAAPATTLVTLDPNIRPALIAESSFAIRRFEELARLCDVVKMSDEDAQYLYPGLRIDAVLDRLLDAGARIAAVTSGSEGAALASPQARVTISAVATTVVDTIGAGDTFMVGLIDGCLTDTPQQADGLSGLGMQAAALAAYSVSRPGADLPWRR